MHRRRTIATLAAFGLAALGATGVAVVGGRYVEDSSREAVIARLASAEMDWAAVDSDGLEIILTGEAPSEPARLRAVMRAGEVVDPSRVQDAMRVTETRRPVAPRFTLEMLRNDAGVSVIGLVPGQGGSALLDELLDDLTDAAPEITNMVETADHPTPDTWEDALRFAMDALIDLPRAQISVEATRVSVAAVADSAEEKLAIETRLTRARPDGVALGLEIGAPRPVVTPFTLRVVLPEGGRPRFEACAVDSEAARTRILAAAASAGFEQRRAGCVLALGSPSGTWGDAVATGIAALSEAGGGVLTFSDADVSLLGLEGADRDAFDRIAAELRTALPDIYTLTAEVPAPATIDGTGEAETGAPEFVATLSPEGQVQLRGRLYDAAQKDAVLAYGRALFGASSTYIATREDATLPQGWPARVLAGMDALARLENGAVIVQPDLVAIRGITGDSNAEAEITRIMVAKLGAETDLRIAVDYREELDPALNIPTPEECEVQLNQVLDEQKLTFAPGEAVIEAAGDDQLGALAELLDLCRRAAFEVGGHTDSQGREEMNASLSEDRAAAVRTALIERGVPPSQLVSRGYGEAQPIADNETEAGREANRRITFTLLGRRNPDAPPPTPQPDPDPETEDATEDTPPAEEPPADDTPEDPTQ